MESINYPTEYVSPADITTEEKFLRKKPRGGEILLYFFETYKYNDIMLGCEGIMQNPIVSVVGRPNVGKSALFNRLTGQKLSIVDDKPGVTRDRIYGECEWRGRKISLIDTGGIDTESDNIIPSHIREQAFIAIDSSDAIIFVTDVKSGITALDEDVSSILKKSGKPVILCVNKCDNVGAASPEFYEFYNLGLGDPVEVSAVHGHGTGDLLDAVFEKLPPQSAPEEEEEFINIAIIGKPNTGKSSLVNKISGQNRCIVSDVAGTTRDSVDMRISNKFGKYNIIDTAGIRRKSKINDRLEKYSVLRSKFAVERSDVCVIMIDATEGITEQDSKIAGIAHEAGKGCVVAVNKWDVIEKDNSTVSSFTRDIEKELGFMAYAPVVFISAKTGQRIDRLFEFVNNVYKSNSTRISTGTLNDLLSRAVTRVQTPTDKGKRLKIYYMTQVSINPPTFVFFVNMAELFHFSYKRYLENCIRDAFGLEGTPIRFIIRQKNNDMQD